jgi:hypothetical protein
MWDLSDVYLSDYLGILQGNISQGSIAVPAIFLVKTDREMGAIPLPKQRAEWELEDGLI